MRAMILAESMTDGAAIASENAAQQREEEERVARREAATATPARRVWTAEEVLAKLETSDVFVERALMAIYARQTDDEQRAQTTSHSNGMGFNGVDAAILSSFAEWVQRTSRPNEWNGRTYAARPEGQRLSVKQTAIARKKLRKYVRQLVAHANGEN